MALSNHTALYLADALRGHAEALDRNTQAQMRPFWSIRQLRDWFGGMDTSQIRALCKRHGYSPNNGDTFHCPLDVVLKVNAELKKAASGDAVNVV